MLFYPSFSNFTIIMNRKKIFVFFNSTLSLCSDGQMKERKNGFETRQYFLNIRCETFLSCWKYTLRQPFPQKILSTSNRKCSQIPFSITFWCVSTVKSPKIIRKYTTRSKRRQQSRFGWIKGINEHQSDIKDKKTYATEKFPT